MAILPRCACVPALPVPYALKNVATRCFVPKRPMALGSAPKSWAALLSMLCGKSHRISFRSAANANHCHLIKLRGRVRCNRWRRDGEWQQQAEEDIAALRGLIWQRPSHTGWVTKWGTISKITLYALSDITIWRMGRDSNPRDACAPAGFQDRCLQPLGHPSFRPPLFSR
jgi:hypothetical protein